MMDFSTQDRLGRFGERWGCLATCFVNLIENELSRPVDDVELLSMIGQWFVSENIWMANYKHHDKLGEDNEPMGWDIIANPEWHFMVADRLPAIADAMYVVGINNLHEEYAIVELETDLGSHFVLEINGAVTVNPDPSIYGTPVEITPVRF